MCGSLVEVAFEAYLITYASNYFVWQYGTPHFVILKLRNVHLLLEPTCTNVAYSQGVID